MVLPGSLRVCTTCVLLLLLCMTAVKATVFVDAAAPDGGDGTSWETAFRTIHDGLSSADSSTNNEVWVKAGTYYENLLLRMGIGLYGGFAGTETSRTESNPAVNETIIDGGQDGNTVIGANQAIIDGFTITNGKVTSSGGGVYCSYVSPTVSNCKITGNTGSGVYCYQSSANIIHCEITGNTNKGIHCYIGGNPTIADCTISGNSATDYAGIYANAGTPTIRRCTVTGNTATGTNGRGGGIAFVSCSTPATVENCVITGNSAAMGGGVYCSVASPSFVNCTIAGNTAATSGGNAYIQTSNPVFRNTILAFGASPLGPVAYKNAAANPTLSYCGYWNPGVSPWFEPIDWDPTNEATAVDLDPLFVDRENGDYHLSELSPCIDAGTSTDVPADDREGCERPYGDLHDIGAYEWSAAAPVTCDTVAAAKMTSDGTLISLPDAIVSGVFDGCFYVEQDDRSSGIRVAWSGAMTTNTHVSITGMIETCGGIERQIRADSVSVLGPGAVEPCGMTARSLVGSDLGSDPPAQIGRTNPYGPNNVGLLVRVWGRGLPSATVGFGLEDMSGQSAAYVLTPNGLAIGPVDGRLVQVTGVCSVRQGTNGLTPLILVRDASDIVLLD